MPRVAAASAMAREAVGCGSGVRDGTTMAGMRDLQKAGVAADVGVSNYSFGRCRDAERALGRPVLSNQVQFSLAHAGPLEDLVPFAAAEGRVVIAWSPLGTLDSGRAPARARLRR